MTRFDVEALTNRLSKFNLREPSFDRIGVERALQEHLRELGCPPRTIRWVDGGAQAYRYGFDWGSVEEFQLSDFLTEIRPLLDAENMLEVLVWAGRTRRSAALLPISQMPAHSAMHAAADAAWRSIPRASYWELRGPLGLTDAHRKENHLAVDRVARFVAALHSRPLIDSASDKVIGIWRPIVDAFDAGLFMYRFTRKEMVCVPQPAIFFESDRMHRTDGPAVEWFCGERHWLWRGVEVPAWVIQRPEQITAAAIRQERNAELRRCMIERFGAERLVKELGGEVTRKDKYGVLWRCNVDGMEAYSVVEVENGAVESEGPPAAIFPDGSSFHAYAA